MTVLRGGEVFTDGQVQRLDVAFGEEIEAIGPDLEAEATLDIEGKLILPGMIDAHVHFRDFNQAHKEDWKSGSAAALCGGVTTVLEMPNNDPPMTTPERVREKRRRASEAGINFGLFGGITPETLSDLAQVAHWVIGYKLYMGLTTGGLVISQRKIQREAFQRVADLGKTLAVHAQREGSHSEAADLEIALELAVQTGARLHLCHVRTREGVELAAEAKGDRVDVTIETCPHYLTFTADDRHRQGTLLKVNPPLASSADRDFLWDALADGTIDTLGSDHAPHTLQEKAVRFEQAPAGLPGVETSLALMLDAVHRGRLSLARLVEVFSKVPAERFGLQGGGAISPGGPADLVVVDLERRATVDRRSVVSKCGWSPYEGLSWQGWPHMTFVHGKRVWAA